MKKKENNNLPLSGINVLDLTNVLSGPYATLILAELGANVIKVEKPNGDDSRKYGPFIGNKSGYFLSLNRGKKSIVIDLKEKSDRVIFEKLLSKVDVLVDNFKPGTLEKFGFSWLKISKKYPKLIHAKISGFGEIGPYKNYSAYDIIVQAMGGIMSLTGSNKNNFVRVGTSVGDIVAGLFCVIGVLSQLLKRKETNIGSKLDLSMLDCQVAILENAITRFSIDKKIPFPLGTDHPSISPFGEYKTQNSSIVIAAGNNKIFKKLCYVINDMEMISNKMFRSNEDRNNNLNELRKRIELKLRKFSSEHWLKKLTQNNIPCSPINNIKDLLSNPQIKKRNMILDYYDPTVGSFKVSGNPIKFNFVKSNKNTKRAPDLDQDREKILKFFDIS